MNCLIIDDDTLARSVISKFVEKTNFLTLSGTFPSAVDALALLNTENDIDLLFLDVEMPEMTGIDLISSIHKLPMVIIMSAKGKYALNAFEYDVIDYLLKPYTYARFIKAVSKAYEIFKQQHIEETGEESFFIKNSSSIIRLKYTEIIWIEALENYVKIHTMDEDFTVHLTMKSIEEHLPASLFIRVHRSHIVNLKKIKLIKENVIIINTNKKKLQIPIARSYRTSLYEKLNLLK